MKYSGLLALVLAAVAVEANMHAERDAPGGHAQLARRFHKRANKEKRCKVRPSSSAAPASTPVAEAAIYTPSSSWVDPAPSSTWVAPTSSSVAPVIMAAATPVASAVAGSVAGLIAVTSSTCGASGATSTYRFILVLLESNFHFRGHHCHYRSQRRHQLVELWSRWRWMDPALHPGFRSYCFRPWSIH